MAAIEIEPVIDGTHKSSGQPVGMDITSTINTDTAKLIWCGEVPKEMEQQHILIWSQNMRNSKMMIWKGLHVFEQKK